MAVGTTITVAEAHGAARRTDALAVVLGWYGSTQRLLRRHAAVLAGAAHIDTVVVAPSLAAASFPPAGRHAARAVAHEIARHDARTPAPARRKRLLFLVLSGHGENLFQHLVLEQVCAHTHTQTHTKTHSPLTLLTSVHAHTHTQGTALDLRRVRGVAHDSAPVQASPVRWAQAATAAAVARLPHALRPHRPVYDVPLLTPLCTAASAAHMALPWNARWIRRSRTATSALVAAATAAAGGRGRALACALPRSLFLYSDCDPLVPAADVRTQAQALRRRHTKCGCLHPESCVRECFFHGSNHVDHLRTHPAQYVDALVRFCRECTEA